MAIIDQLINSGLSLDGTSGYSNRQFGYLDNANLVNKLHDVYSINSTPSVHIVDFNGSGVINPESHLDETDNIAPNNQTGIQIYKSSTGQNYQDLGPLDGHY